MSVGRSAQPIRGWHPWNRWRQWRAKRTLHRLLEEWEREGRPLTILPPSRTPEAYFDAASRLWWVPCTPELIPDLAEWSEPVQIRIHAGMFEARRVQPSQSAGGSEREVS